MRCPPVPANVRCVSDGLDELYQVSQAVLSVTRQMSVRDVLQVIVRSARSLVGARYAALGVPDEGDSFAEFVVDGISWAEWQAIGPLPRRHGMLAVLLNEGKPERLGDIRKDPRFEGWPSAHPQMSHFLGMPVRDGDQVLGIIFAANKTSAAAAGRGFTERDEEILVAVRRARRDRADQRPAVRAQPGAFRHAGAVPAGQGPARRGHAEAVQHPGARPGRRGPGRQGAGGRGPGPGRDRGRRRARRRSPRRAARGDRRPGPARPGGGRAGRIPAPVRGAGRPGARRPGHVHGRPRCPALGPRAEAALYRVAQEALHNALRHAGASGVRVALAKTARQVVLEVSDDGHGFVPEAPSGGLGLASMRERAAAAGGALTIRSGANGTMVRMTVPVKTVPVKAGTGTERAGGEP